MNTLKQQKILITNDDGIQSPGLQALINELGPNYDITVVGPKHPQSAKGMSHAHGDSWVSITESVENNVNWITVDNSPTTCISVALRVFKLNPDLIISGINYGENLGLNLFYSGTVGAAWEGAVSGVLSLASSIELPSEKHFSIERNVDFTIPAFITKKIAVKLLNEKPTCKLWNLNIPSKVTSTTEIKKCKIASKRWNEPIVREIKQELNQRKIRFEFDPSYHFTDEENDIELLRKGFITLSEIRQINFSWASL